MNNKLLIIPLFLFFVMWQLTAYFNNNKPSVKLRISLSSEIPKSAFPILTTSQDCPTDPPPEKTIEDIARESNIEETASLTNIQKDYCISRNMGYICNTNSCDCLVNNEQICNTIKQNKITEETEGKTDEKPNTQIYWDPHVWINNPNEMPRHQGGCISTIRALGEGLVEQIEEADSKKGYSWAYEAGDIDTKFRWVEPYIKCNNLSSGEGNCEVIRNANVNVPSSYCSEEFVDYALDKWCDVSGQTFTFPVQIPFQLPEKIPIKIPYNIPSCESYLSSLNPELTGNKRDVEVGYCYVNRAQKIFEDIFGEGLIRAIRGGDFGYLMQKINPVFALADIFCAKVLGKKGGCGIPKIFPSLQDLIWLAKNFVKVFSMIGDAIKGAFDKGIKAIAQFATDIGERIGDFLQGALNAAIDFIKGIGSAIGDFFVDIADKVSDFFNDVGDALGCSIL